MDFSRKTLWTECENKRLSHNMTMGALSHIVFPTKDRNVYNARRNLLDGGLLVPIKTLQYFGLTSLIISKRVDERGQRLTSTIAVGGQDLASIQLQLIRVCRIMAFNTHVSLLPQPIQVAMSKDCIFTNLSLTTFEKAFNIIGDISLEFVYGLDQPNNLSVSKEGLASMEEMFI